MSPLIQTKVPSEGNVAELSSQATAVALKAEPVELSLAHSPDSDDAFMFYGLATRKVRSGRFKFKHVLEDIETLNRKAREGVYDITAVSFHGYAHVAGAYALLTCGASFGERYGPLVVAKRKLGDDGLKGKTVAVPGELTTANLVLHVYEPGVKKVVVPFDKIMDAVVQGEADAGVIIHEGQLTYSRAGLRKVVDLGEWWHQETGLLLPLGGNAVRRSLGPAIRETAELLRASIQYGLDHREEALDYALQFSRGLDRATADRFVAMYVNERTLDYGSEGRRAVQTLLDRGFETGLIPERVEAEFVE
jgi:5,8-dihydroxy-2-naphthoate synthase